MTFADFAFFDPEEYHTLANLVQQVRPSRRTRPAVPLARAERRGGGWQAAEMAPEEELGFDWEFAGIGGPPPRPPPPAVEQAG
eukprot:SAG11_NODE_16208_length_554_cov_1.454945_1_plen_82_part_10